MRKTDASLFVHNEQRGHSSEFEQLYLLLVQIGDLVITVRQADKRHFVCRPKQFERRRAIGTHGENFRIAFYKFLIVLTQLRQMLAAVWSSKPAQKRQHDIFLAAKI